MASFKIPDWFFILLIRYISTLKLNSKNIKLPIKPILETRYEKAKSVVSYGISTILLLPKRFDEPIPISALLSWYESLFIRENILSTL